MHAVETLEDVTQTCTCREPRLSRFCRNPIHRDLTVKLPRVSIYPFLEVIQNRAASSSVTMPGNTGRRTSGTALIKHDCGIARDKSDTWQCNLALERDSSQSIPGMPSLSTSCLRAACVTLPVPG